MKEKTRPNSWPTTDAVGKVAASNPEPDLDGLLESLLRIGHDRDQLKEYLAKLDEVSPGRDPIVTSRLRDEYGSRLQSVRQEAEPIVSEIREHCLKVVQAKDGVRRELEGARLDKEERELRREVGELGGDALERQIADADTRIAQSQAKLQQVDDLVELLQQGLQDYLEGEPVEPDSNTDPAGPTSAADSTHHAAPPVEAAASQPDVTIVAPKASLRTSDGSQEFHVGRFALIGGEDCHIALDNVAEPGALASIAFADGRFTLKQEGASLASRVNGESVANHPLRDGDRISIGEVELVFRCR